MRDIKFRAWHKNHKKMIYGDNDSSGRLYLDLNGHPCSEGDAGSMRSPEPYFPWYRSDHIILMQFTGLHDKNGKDIYEGDIVRGDTSRYRNVCIGVVEYHGLAFGYWGNQSDGSKWMDTITSAILEPRNIEQGIEVIGNIYNNPELLTRKG